MHAGKVAKSCLHCGMQSSCKLLQHYLVSWCCFLDVFLHYLVWGPVVELPRVLCIAVLGREPGVRSTLTTFVMVTDPTNGRNAYTIFSPFHMLPQADCI